MQRESLIPLFPHPSNHQCIDSLIDLQVEREALERVLAAVKAEKEAMKAEKEAASREMRRQRSYLVMMRTIMVVDSGR